MNILIVAEDFPWPSNMGGLLRLSKTIEAVSQMGKTDLFAIYDSRRTLPPLPQTVHVERLKTVRYPEAASLRKWRTSWLASGRLPREVVMHSFDMVPRQEFESWVADGYDVVWFSTARMYEWMGRPRLGPTIVDIDDLKDEKARLRARLMWEERRHNGLADTIRSAAAVFQERVDARVWRRFQRSVIDDADRAILCSELDIQRLGLPQVVLIPNAYARPVAPVGRAEVGNPPTIMFQGSLHYHPNADAVNWLIDEIAPRLWDRVPKVQIRLVGRATPSIKLRHHPPAVTIVGEVPTMEPELARADVAVVPLRNGSGTRIKILESFAHRVPVVSTTIGAEGLDIEPGVHLLVADEPDAFARSCEQLLTDQDLRKRLVDAAEERYHESYEWSIARNRICGLVREVAETKC